MICTKSLLAGAPLLPRLRYAILGVLRDSASDVSTVALVTVVVTRPSPHLPRFVVQASLEGFEYERALLPKLEGDTRAHDLIEQRIREADARRSNTDNSKRMRHGSPAAAEPSQGARRGSAAAAGASDVGMQSAANGRADADIWTGTPLNDAADGEDEPDADGAGSGDDDDDVSAAGAARIQRKWNCPRCTLENDAAAAACAMCEAERPGSVDSNNSAAVAAAAAAAGSGSARVTATADHEPTTSPTGSGAAGTSASLVASVKWYCKLCTVENVGTAIRCYMCEQPRDVAASRSAV